MPADPKGVIAIVPIGTVPNDLLVSIVQSAPGVVPFQFQIVKQIELPKTAYDPERKQYVGDRLLSVLEKYKLDQYDRVVGVIDTDCYAPGLNFIFGQASPDKGVAIVALPRLRQSYYHMPEDDALFRKRVLKEVIHELGHTWNLPHCPNPQCVMHFSNSLPDTDQKDDQFCSICRSKLKF